MTPVWGGAISPYKALVNQIESEYGVKIELPKVRAENLEETMTLTVRGPEDDVDACALVVQ